MFKGVNKVVRAYIYWEFVVNSAWGLLAPVFAIFLLETVAKGNIVQGAKIAGFSTLFYWITKSVLQIPIAMYLDKNHGEKDDYWFYVLGSLLTGFIPFGFLFANTAWHIYFLQIFHAVGMAMVIPASYAIFIRHADRGKEAYESGLNSTLLGLGVGITGAIGGIIAGYFGFKIIFILTGLLTFLAVACLLMVKNDMLPKTSRNIHKFPINKHGEGPVSNRIIK